jgi:hypothetical protein
MASLAAKVGRQVDRCEGLAGDSAGAHGQVDGEQARFENHRVDRQSALVHVVERSGDVGDSRELAATVT